jgi:hypothetical protein
MVKSLLSVDALVDIAVRLVGLVCRQGVMRAAARDACAPASAAYRGLASKGIE